MYVPLNPNVFTAAYAGAMAGMAAAGRNPTDSDTADYSDVKNSAGAFAEEFDTQWGVTVATSLDMLTINNEVLGAFSGRADRDSVAGDYANLASALIAIVLSARVFFATNGITPPAWNNGGGGGGTGYLPPDPPPNGTNNTLAESAGGVPSWQPVGGYNITGFGLSGAGVAPTVEVGSSIANINWAATFNFMPLTISVTCTGKPTQTPAPTGDVASGTFAGPFTGPINGDTVTVQITVTDPTGAPHVANANIVFATKVVWGSVASPVVSQGLWDTLNTANHFLSVSGSGNLPFASSPGQQQVIGRLASLGTPTLKDSGGDVYPPVLLPLSPLTIVENGTSQSYNFYTVGSPGVTFSWSMT